MQNLKQLLKEIRKIEERKRPYYIGHNEFMAKEHPYLKSDLKLRDLELVGYKCAYGGTRIFAKSDLVSIKPCCLICSYNVVVDVHHVYGKAIFLCLNHHAIIHRIITRAHGKCEDSPKDRLIS
jgi:hypothetical protein